MKVCKDCKIEKPDKDFPWRTDQNKYRLYCKACATLRRKPSRAVYLEKTKEYRQIKGKEYKQKNREKIKESTRLYNIKNREKIKLKNNKYEIANKDRMAKIRNEYRKNKIKSDAVYCMKLRLRARIKDYIRKENWTKNKRFDEYIGCTPEEFKSYIESKFADGMNWDNRHLWHLDHIIPLSSAKCVEDLLKLNHFSNIQPLWAEDNIQKSDKILKQ